jgi:putative addiction module CopG family antidote
MPSRSHTIRVRAHRALAPVYLPGGRVPAYISGMDNVTLPPDLERFAAEAVTAGRYRDVSAVVTAGIELLRQRETACADLLRSVAAAEESGERHGFLTLDAVMADADAIIAEMAGRPA